jgi:hypothetical protein
MPITEETRHIIYNKLKFTLETFCPPFVPKESSTQNSYELIGNKPVPYGYNKKIVPGMFFASIIHRKDSVAFHFFPSYYNPGLREVAPMLYKYLKGKTCFHFNKEEQIDEKELRELLKKGMNAWKELGYLEE